MLREAQRAKHLLEAISHAYRAAQENVDQNDELTLALLNTR